MELGKVPQIAGWLLELFLGKDPVIVKLLPNSKTSMVSKVKDREGVYLIHKDQVSSNVVWQYSPRVLEERPIIRCHRRRSKRIVPKSLKPNPG